MVSSSAQWHLKYFKVLVLWVFSLINVHLIPRHCLSLQSSFWLQYIVWTLIFLIKNFHQLRNILRFKKYLYLLNTELIHAFTSHRTACSNILLGNQPDRPIIEFHNGISQRNTSITSLMTVSLYSFPIKQSEEFNIFMLDYKGKAYSS